MTILRGPVPNSIIEKQVIDMNESHRLVRIGVGLDWFSRKFNLALSGMDGLMMLQNTY